MGRAADNIAPRNGNIPSGRSAEPGGHGVRGLQWYIFRSDSDAPHESGGIRTVRDSAVPLPPRWPSDVRGRLGRLLNPASLAVGLLVCAHTRQSRATDDGRAVRSHRRFGSSTVDQVESGPRPSDPAHGCFWIISAPWPINSPLTRRQCGRTGEHQASVQSVLSNRVCQSAEVRSADEQAAWGIRGVSQYEVEVHWNREWTWQERMLRCMNASVLRRRTLNVVSLDPALESWRHCDEARFSSSSLSAHERQSTDASSDDDPERM
ncbi:unnamed protein product [Mycena citricolor]|uniref:Uncharacterized protein n=1 Tax=Mycena citricolor TaxID=2018698 RepID=A0AAD2I062_9AGAR|nr:unnamed protein product [Mycena citricolor]